MPGRLSTAFVSRGVTFSFQENSGEGAPLPETNASICEGSRIDPLGFGTVNHLVTGPMGYPCGGGRAGQLNLTFSSAPREVRFALRAPAECSVPTLAFAADEGDPFHRSAGVFSYTSGNEFTAEQYAIEWTHPGGIASITVFISGCDLYVDNLVIIP